ncbi:MAG: acetate/propionate family kinase [Beijerinckiaceae bacterium]|nr:MAG: acetate/propionate family kinase [Beijerinckiaceae bacterium]
MQEAILTINIGSSSVKFAVYEARAPEPVLLFKGTQDDRALIIHDPAGKPIKDVMAEQPAHEAANPALLLLDRVESLLPHHTLAAAGHRIVHGGPGFSAPVLIDGDVLSRLDALTPLAPLHQPRCLEPVRQLFAERPDLAQVACFDTAFHRDMPALYHRFPLSREFEAKGIRRYGFHGLSFEYIARKLDRLDLRVVVAHLGSGCSLCAIDKGKSVNTTMSLTPLDGVMMATRSGAIDPGLLLYLQRAEAMSVSEIEDLLYHRSGLLGVSGISADIRTLLASADEKAKEAIAQFCARIAEQICVMATAMNGLDRLVFTGGIGEHNAEIRKNICARLEWLGIAPPDETGEDHPGRIPVLTIPTDEEFIIALHTMNVLAQRGN